MSSRRVVLVLALAALAASQALADCTGTIRARSSTKITIGYATCADLKTLPAAGDDVTIVAGDEKIPTKVVKAGTDDVLGLGTLIQVASTDPEVESVTLINNEATVKATVGTATINATVQSPTPNYFKYTWSVGPATTGAENGKSDAGGTPTLLEGTDGDTKAPANGNALRLQYSADYAHTVQSFRNPQTLATLNIDTTDQNDPGFIDNNRASLGLRWNLPPAGNVLKQGKVGFEGRASKAFHNDVHDIDGAVTFAGWVPMLQTLNLLNKSGDFISTPLSFKLSYGYRNREQSGDTFHGQVFEASALYHIFALDQYKLDLNGTWTVNDLNNRPATTPRTQRMYKATFSYLADPSKGFSVLTTIEDGSAGVMLTKVRQYFVGLALSKLNFSGGGK